jgi:hypothetical protein
LEDVNFLIDELLCVLSWSIGVLCDFVGQNIALPLLAFVDVWVCRTVDVNKSKLHKFLGNFASPPPKSRRSLQHRVIPFAVTEIISLPKYQGPYLKSGPSRFNPFSLHFKDASINMRRVPPVFFLFVKITHIMFPF